MISPNMRILIVDDFATMRKMLRNILKQLGFTNVEEADNGLSALEKLRSENFNFVIADLNMPNVSGLELLKVMKDDEKMKNIPVLMVTAVGDKDSILEAAVAGVSDYVVKPFTAETLKGKIDNLFKQ